MLAPRDFVSPEGHAVGRYLTEPHTAGKLPLQLKHPAVLRAGGKSRALLPAGAPYRPVTEEEAELQPVPVLTSRAPTANSPAAAGRAVDP